MEIIGGDGVEIIGGNIKVWDEITLSEKLDEVQPGSIQVGDSFVYMIWKSLLNKWLGYEDSRVYMASPFLDAQRLKDVCRIILCNNAEEKLERFYVRDECYFQTKIEDIKKQVKNLIESQCRNRLESFYEKIVPKKLFHAKFIGCVNGDDAEVLVSSANFTNQHFDCKNLETVCYMKMTKNEFVERFIQKLQ